MGRTMIAALIAMGMLTGCTDWREGGETVEACVQRFALKKGAVHPLADDPGQWVPSYTYDITRMEDARAFGKEVRKRGGTYRFVLGNPAPEGHLQRERDLLQDVPATEAGAVLLAGDPSLYKVRGKTDAYRALLRQGCEGQRTGMRLLDWQAAREEVLVDGELPKLPMSAAQMREIQNKIDKPSIKDLIP